MSHYQKNRNPVEVFKDMAANQCPVVVFLAERPHITFEALLIGYDEFMNVVLDQVVEINSKTNAKTLLGQLLLKSDCIAMVAERPIDSAMQ